MTPLRTFLAAAAVVGLIGTGAALRSGPSTAHATPAVLTDGSIPDVAERVVDSVVNISTSHAVEAGPAAFDPFFSNPFSPGFGDPGDRKAMSKGSGVIVTASGRILTNAHVVKDAEDIKVTLHDGNDYDAKVVGVDPKADLAVIQLKGTLPVLKPLTFGDSSTLRLGEVVLAIGDPFGVGKSVTMGIVSAKGRGGMGIEEYEDFIQTDAAINPGNSGGALVSARGELVGINTAIFTQSGGYQGIGFAVPSNLVRHIVDELQRYGEVRRGSIGYLEVAPLTTQAASELNAPSADGVVITGLRQGPASRAGLEQYDIILSVDGRKIGDTATLLKLISDAPIGSSVSIEVLRDGRRQTFKVPIERQGQRMRPRVR